MKLKPPSLPLAGVLALACLAGCSSGLEGVEKRLGSMQDDITKLQNQNDRLVERLDAMEVEDSRAKNAGKPASAPTPSERPSLKVVKVVPEDTSGMPSPQVGTPLPGDAVDDPSPRPMIRLRGSGKSDSKTEAKSEG